MKVRYVLLISGFFILFGLSALLYQLEYLERSPPVVERYVENPENITILWAKWAPADILQQLTLEFTENTGIGVTIVQEPWSTWQEKFFREMENRGKKYDMVIGDSQWLGRGASDGHYVELTKWIREKKVDQSMTASSITGYSEFPKGSGHYWAVPAEGDAMGFSYRKDLFENPAEKTTFLKRYGYQLGIPETWGQLLDIAKFFYRPEEDFYGVLAWVEPDYDGITMGVQSVIWAWGGHLGNQSNYKVQGILNSKESVDGLIFYKELNSYNNPDWRNFYLDTNKNSNTPMMSGKVAMAMGYFAINTELLDPLKNPYADSIGFFANPRGPAGRVSSLGGQGISIVSYTPKKEQCFRFLEWFVKEETQKRWAKMGGLSCNTAVLSSDEFLNSSPINRPFKESIEMARDFWAVPEYSELLAVSQRHWHEYVTNEGIDARETLDRVAGEWENIFERYGYYKE